MPPSMLYIHFSLSGLHVYIQSSLSGLHDPLYFELAQRILVHPPAHLEQLCPNIGVSPLGPLLESLLKQLSGQAIICNAKSDGIR